jgi:hypothetical protein
MKQPINRLLMLRARGLGGPVFQRVGSNLFAHSSGAAIAGQAVVTPDPNIAFKSQDPLRKT